MELYSGKWQGYYSSQSEADLAFANLIVMKHKIEIKLLKNISMLPGLGKELKPYRTDYVNGLIQ